MQEKPSRENENKDPNVRVVKEFHPNGRLKSSTEAVGKLRQGISRDYRSDGTLENEIHYEQNRKHGPARSYYSDGKTVRNEILYVNGYKQGTAKWFYESGKIYRETPYDKNMIQGIRKSYYEDGRLQAETPYLSDQPGTGLKEYTRDGKLKEIKKAIRIREQDRISIDGSFILLLDISDGTKNVNFYQGNLMQGQYWNDQLTPVPTEKGRGEIHFYVAKGTFKMETLNIVARIKTSLGNPLILQKQYNLAVENKL
jgi:hypothetical protein